MRSYFFYPASRGQECPTGRVTELQIKFGHFEPEIRVPGTASADVEQSGSGLREHVASVDKMQINCLTRAKRLGEDQSDKVIAASC